MSDSQISFPAIPESAANGIEFCLWSLEKAGVRFRNGKTAAYWHLIATLSQHIESGGPAGKPATPCGSVDVRATDQQPRHQD